MATYHTKTIYANSSLTRIQNPNKSNMEQPIFHYKDMMLINFHVVDSSNSVVDLSGATFALAIDSGFGANKALVRSNNGNFTAIDLVNGKISCKVDMNDARVGTYLDGNVSQVGYVGLWAYIGSISYLLCQFQITIENIIK